MKRAIIITFSCIILLAIAIVSLLNYNNATSQKDITLQRDTTCLGTFPLINGLVSPGGLRSFLIDTGSDLSMITPGSLEALKDKGFRVDSTFCPVFYRDNIGRLRFTTKRYTVDLPISPYYVDVSDDGVLYFRRGKSVENVLRNVNFVPAADGVDIFGLDILRKLILEYRADMGTIAIHTRLPKGYEELTTIYDKIDPAVILGAGRRYYIDMTIDGKAHSYFLDSALDLVQVKHPASDTIYARNPIHSHSIITAQGRVIRAKNADNEWAQIGNRAGRTSVYYYDDDEEAYSINPLRFSNQDVIIDFPARKIMYRPQFDVAGYPRK